ncbi:D-hexose-6-phosphate mutarotase [Occultella glacieicola]|uniref:Putative glucose-6-phosphate 1-epimerase n=1 Tax=Occultella glacieicola TaxID=2518684 RepID=A0ABY2DZN9_9MICO|nr:D-hexose-6-phosphate mutarotase [Occultella glacieicola]TDE90351.1 D-hexose-6-phosphate mutarotase [Occultella glacieicola]
MAQELSERPEIAPGVTLTTGEAGLPMIRVERGPAAGSLYLHGAHVVEWVPVGRGSVLWRSAVPHDGGSGLIRGGVPICFPWFGSGPDGDRDPLHGFAGRLPWELDEIRDTDDGVLVVLQLSDSPATTVHWPHRFEATYQVLFGEDLRLSLQVRNTGTEAFTFEQALHSYFTVNDVAGIAIRGLEGATYTDRAPGAAHPRGVLGGPLHIVGETDRVFEETTATTYIQDTLHTVRIAKTGASSTVVWNPWTDKAQVMPDFGDDEWPWMVCVESGNVGSDAITLSPGQAHTMTTTITLD